MSKLKDVLNNDLISFTLVKSGIIGSGFSNVLVQGMVNYSVAMMVDPEIIVKHNALFPYFGDKDNNSNPNDYEFLMIKDDTNGKLFAIGVTWINDASVEIISKGNWKI